MVLFVGKAFDGVQPLGKAGEVEQKGTGLVLHIIAVQRKTGVGVIWHQNGHRVAAARGLGDDDIGVVHQNVPGQSPCSFQHKIGRALDVRHQEQRKAGQTVFLGDSAAGKRDALYPTPQVVQCLQDNGRAEKGAPLNVRGGSLLVFCGGSGLTFTGKGVPADKV